MHFLCLLFIRLGFMGRGVGTCKAVRPVRLPNVLQWGPHAAWALHYTLPPICMSSSFVRYCIGKTLFWLLICKLILRGEEVGDIVG